MACVVVWGFAGVLFEQYFLRLMHHLSHGEMQPIVESLLSELTLMGLIGLA